MTDAYVYPASSPQRRLWLQSRIDGDDPAHAILDAIELDGPLDAPALQHAISTIVARHETLRTGITLLGNRVVQVIFPATDVVVETARVQGGIKEVEQLARASAHRPFDIEGGSLFRPALLRLGPSRHVLLLVMHHLVTDGWSLEVFARELATCYAARTADNPTALPALAIQYRDYAVWEQRRLARGAFDRHLTAWRQLLDGADLSLGLEQAPNGHRSTEAGARVPVAISADTTAALVEVAREQRVTLFAVLLSAYALVLSAWTQLATITVGVALANRTRPQLEDLIGFFVNVLPLRIAVNETTSFGALATRTNEQIGFAVAHQDVPFDRVAEALRRPGGGTRQTIPEAVFAFHNVPRHEVPVAGLRVRYRDVDPGVSEFAVGLQLSDAQDGVRGYLHHRLSACTPGAARSLAHAFAALLDAIADRARSCTDLLAVSAAAHARTSAHARSA